MQEKIATQHERIGSFLLICSFESTEKARIKLVSVGIASVRVVGIKQKQDGFCISPLFSHMKHGVKSLIFDVSY